jgi:quercetin dioxygenase-like cupin family protein
MSDDPSMTYLPSITELVELAPESTVSRTVLKGEGARLVLFSFAAGQELSEHTAAVPVILQTMDGSLQVTASGETVTLAPGDVIHLPSRLPHSVLATEPSRMLLTMLDPRQAAPLKPTH